MSFRGWLTRLRYGRADRRFLEREDVQESLAQMRRGEGVKVIIKRFEASDLASLQEAIDEFVDGLLEKGLDTWRCTYSRGEVVQTKHGYMEGFVVDGWHCLLQAREHAMDPQ